jgi:hypothetical protein
VREGLRLRLMNWYNNTSAVPDADRDGRDMPTFDPTLPFPDAGMRRRELLDGGV